MEITCNRCHRTVQTEDCYCPACGLPQLVYSAEDAAAQGSSDRFNEPVRDAGSIAWRPALRVVLMLAIPAGLLCSAFSPVGILGLLWMAAAAAWAVLLYVRSQQAPWITLGAGARIGLVTGILGGWTAAATTGLTLVVMRFLLHQDKDIDGFWLSLNDQLQKQLSAGADAQSVALVRSWILSPEGRAGFALVGIVLLVSMLLFFAVAGGALGARLSARTRRPQV
jgi:hypothetical protein